MKIAKQIIITNNPKVKAKIEEAGSTGNLLYCNSRDEVYVQVRKHIHRNWHLQNHAMYGNIQLNKQPYRTIFLIQGTELDLRGLTLWEYAMEQANRMPFPHYSESILNDFQELDYTLCSGGSFFPIN